ncbi:MarR family winged helix-turn-helix transcriptional regulator [Solirubrobacter ginsenosidimutans]|uniref:MarR family winged helix-turn-helix transcriptional regulator n=1 Tax=Solirubrobacter ginsenosidimutans TaxID=490573 RepID=A0A9X3S4T1_9ACTN|nr:MarR family winged helix-turn-helix transcriptional regulator [Solirubrobacter ginsenosidimutans]MDA0160933.1 MarR family winged helix-turn-helix transcriptional regulator [Solirubrobacter ginsenosidimutans]
MPAPRIPLITELPIIEQPLHRSGALLDLLTRRLRVAGESALNAANLRPRHLLVLTVLRDLGESSQADLATTLQLDRTNLVGLLNELETDGLIERRRSPEDRRRHTVVLTQDGRERLAAAEFTLAAAEDVVFAALTHKQRETLYELLLKATAAGC